MKLKLMKPKLIMCCFVAFLALGVTACDNPGGSEGGDTTQQNNSNQ